MGPKLASRSGASQPPRGPSVAVLVATGEEVRSGRKPVAFAVGGYIAAAYWFTSTSFGGRLSRSRER